MVFDRETRSIRHRLLQDIYSSYVAGCLTYSEHKELVKAVRLKLSWDNLLGVKQLSIYDMPAIEDIVMSE